MGYVTITQQWMDANVAPRLDEEVRSINIDVWRRERITCGGIGIWCGDERNKIVPVPDLTNCSRAVLRVSGQLKYAGIFPKTSTGKFSILINDVEAYTYVEGESPDNVFHIEMDVLTDLYTEINNFKAWLHQDGFPCEAYEVIFSCSLELFYPASAVPPRPPPPTPPPVAPPWWEEVGAIILLMIGGLILFEVVRRRK